MSAVARERPRRRPVPLAARVMAVLAVGALALAPRAVAAGTDEEALRARIKRFYVLSYLNRHGELWELFTPDLKARMGDDKREYIRSTRQVGFELYASRIESLAIRGMTATADVALQVKLPGSLDVEWRRHRMAWKASGSDGWLYAGSLDVTHDDRPLDGEPLLATPQARAPEIRSPENLLPPRPASATRAEKATAAGPSAPTPSSAAAADSPERWDLVAVPPPGRTPPPTTAEPGAPATTRAVTTPQPSAAAAATPAPAITAEASPAPARASASVPLLPPDRAASAAVAQPPRKPDATPATAKGGEGDVAEPLERIVERAGQASGIRRLRALDYLRTSADPRLPDLAARVLADAPASSQVVLLERLGALGSARHAEAVARLLRAPEPDVRAAALLALGELGSADHGGRVVRLLSEEQVAAPRAAAFQALGLLGGGGEAGRALVARSIADQKLGDDERAAAARAAGLARIAEAEPALLRVLGQRRPHLTTLAAIESAGRLATPGLVLGLESLAEDGGLLETLNSSQPVRLLALRALCGAEVPGAGSRLAAEMTVLGRDATVLDVERVAETGDAEALASLLAHPSELIRVRASDLLAVVVDDPSLAGRLVRAVDLALADPGSARALAALRQARERLRQTAGLTTP